MMQLICFEFPRNLVLCVFGIHIVGLACSNANLVYEICLSLLDFRNLLVHEAGYLKVADFGLGKLLDVSEATQQYLMTGETGSCKLLLLLSFSAIWMWHLHWIANAYFISDYSLLVIFCCM